MFLLVSRERRIAHASNQDSNTGRPRTHVTVSGLLLILDWVAGVCQRANTSTDTAKQRWKDPTGAHNQALSQPRMYQQRSTPPEAITKSKHRNTVTGYTKTLLTYRASACWSLLPY